MLAALLLTACGSDSDESDETADATTEPTERDFSGDRAEDKAEIESMFDELLARVKAGDVGVLYDDEFTYLKQDYTYDDYLNFAQIQAFDFSNVEELNILEYNFRGEDTCEVLLEAVFKTPDGGEQRQANPTLIYYHEGEWIKPTISGIGNGPALQRRLERSIFEAESAAAAEAAEGL